jgi:hypothetical protein
MSLRAFHLFFIGLSVVLAAFCAAWATAQYFEVHRVVYAVGGVASIAAAAALIAYGAAFQKKTRHLVALLLVLAVPRAAFACPVCFGQNDSPMASATNLGIVVMLGFTVAMLVAFASFFIYLVRRARLAAEGRLPAPAPRLGGDAQQGTVQC